MENRSLSFAVGLIAVALLSPPLSAAESGASAEQQADWNLRLEKAAALTAEGEARQQEAGRLLEEKNIACRKKFLVNACLKKNDEEYMAVARQARQMSNEGKAIELQVKKEQLSDRDLRRQAEMPQREAELRERQAETAANRQATAEREAAIRADKEKKAEEGAKRKAAEAEKLRQRQAAHDARVAEKMQKAPAAPAAAGSTKE